MANEGFGQLSTLFDLTGSALTTSYQDVILSTKGVPEKYAFYGQYTKGSSAESGIDFRVQVSEDGTTYRDSAAASLLNKTATKNFRKVLEGLSRLHKNVKVSVRAKTAAGGTGTRLIIKCRADRSPVAF